MKSSELLQYIIKTPKYYNVLVLSENRFKILAAW